jgi:hypothetical protein
MDPPFFTRLVDLGLITAMGWAVAACDADKSGDKTRAQERGSAIEADAALLSDISGAGEEFSRRLRDHVVRDGGVLLVSEELAPKVTSLYAFPASVPWSITCSFVGLYVTFGQGTSEQGGIVDVTLSQAILNDQQCRPLVLRLSREILAIAGSAKGEEAMSVAPDLVPVPTQQPEKGVRPSNRAVGR